MHRFQARHGLTVDGIVREADPRRDERSGRGAARAAQDQLVRLRSLSGNLGPQFVMCNIPAAQIEAIENGVAVTRHTAVVGKPDRASPDINSRIVEINFNPFWTVPVSIVQKDLIPKMQEEPDYLTKHRIRIFDQRGNELQPHADQLVFRRSGQLHVQAGSGRLQFARCDPHQFSRPRTASTCTTRRRRICSARISASIPRAACACRMCANW